MLFFGTLSLLVAAAYASTCYKDVKDACKLKSMLNTSLESNCNATYGGFEGLQVEFQTYANLNIDSSFIFLLMSSYFGNFENQREGLKKLYRKYSDELWEDGIDIIKYIAKRGGTMNFNQLHEKDLATVLEVDEINSLAIALDIQKTLATEALRIHNKAQIHAKYDAAITQYIEEQFLESQTERVRNLAGYTVDLNNLLKERDPTIAVFLFDEYLKKSV